MSRGFVWLVSTVSLLGLASASALATRATTGDGSIFFYRNEAGTTHVYSVAPDGTGLERHTFGPDGNSLGPVSPDGTRMAAAVDTGEACGTLYWAQGDELYVMNADGSGAVRLTDDCPQAEWAPSWSPSGRRLVFVRDGEIWTMRADGSEQAALTCDSTANGDNWPDWSPDGRTIAFVRRGRVLVMSPDGTGVRQLTSGDPTAVSASFSPDGARILFGTTGAGVFTVAVAGGEPVRLDDGADWDPVWSPDGSQIVFDSNREHPREARHALYTMDADGGHVTRIYEAGDPTIAGDGDSSVAAWWPASQPSAGSEPDVTPAETACPESPGGTDMPPAVPPTTPGTVAATDVSAPDRLAVAKVSFAPRVLRSKRPFTLTIGVSEAAGARPVVGAQVAVVSVPSGLVRAAPLRVTGADGTAAIRLVPTKRLRLGSGRLVLSVRVRQPGAAWAGGVSGRRLVSIRTTVR